MIVWWLCDDCLLDVMSCWNFTVCIVTDSSKIVNWTANFTLCKLCCLPAHLLPVHRSHCLSQHSVFWAFAAFGLFALHTLKTSDCLRHNSPKQFNLNKVSFCKHNHESISQSALSYHLTLILQRWHPFTKLDSACKPFSIKDNVAVAGLLVSVIGGISLICQRVPSRNFHLISVLNYLAHHWSVGVCV